MTKDLMKYLTFLFLILLSFLPVAGQESAESKQLAKWLEKFPEADTNKDGTLTKEEAVAYRETKKSNRPRPEGSKKENVIAPTHRDVSYGDHMRHVLDVWIPAESADDLPFPVLIFFHGGGFVAGDKKTFDPSSYLEAGIACVSCNYRFVDGRDTFALDSLSDGARAVQTVRHHAKKWNLDTGRIAISGKSAGAVIAMWIGYIDDLANEDSEDPIARESTRVSCLVPLNGPTNLLPSWIHANLGGPKHVHGSFPKMFGASADRELSAEVEAAVKKVSPWEHLSKDDPPTLTVYSDELGEVPLPENASTGRLIHHPYFGKALKEKLDELGIENDFHYNTDPRREGIIPIFLKNHFSMID